jgi:hyaluronan synthase
MRGSFIRAWWRFRYLPLRGFAYWENLLMWVTFVLALILFTSVVISEPVIDGRRSPALAGLVLALVLTYAASSRFFMISRGDQRMVRQLLTFCCAPVVGLWSMLVLRPLRLYAMATCRTTAWGTRAKVEIALGREAA